MAGRDVTIPEPASEHRRRGLLLAAALASMALLAIGVAIGSRVASPRELTVRESVPAVVRPGRSVKVERTPAGAVAAAARSITAFDGNVLLEPVRLQAVVSRIASRQTRLPLLAAFAEASAQTRAKLGADTVPHPVIVLRSVPVGYRMDAFSPDEATVSVWYVGIVGSGATVEPQQSWRTQTVSLVWEHGDWKVASFESSAGPTPPLSGREATTPAGEIFTAVGSFAEIPDAG